jgi:hypothetical protein
MSRGAGIGGMFIDRRPLRSRTCGGLWILLLLLLMDTGTGGLFDDSLGWKHAVAASKPRNRLTELDTVPMPFISRLFRPSCLCLSSSEVCIQYHLTAL